MNSLEDETITARSLEQGDEGQRDELRQDDGGTGEETEGDRNDQFKLLQADLSAATSNRLLASSDPIELISDASLQAPNKHIRFALRPSGDTSHESAQASEDTSSTYYSARSQISFRSFFTRSTDQRSQPGATWLHDFRNTIQSGFGSGAPRSAKFPGVREGRERGGYLPQELGVGRTGKRSQVIPETMLRALGVRARENEQMSNADRISRSISLAFAKNGFWNVSLDDLHRRDGSAVPIVVLKSIQALDLHGLFVKELYSCPISMKDIKMNLDIFELFNNDFATIEGLDFRNSELFNHDIKILAAAFHTYFQALPDTPIPSAYRAALSKAQSTEDTMERNDQFHSIISNLSEAHHETLKVLVQHLNRVVQKSDVNGQDCKTLCKVWARNLFGFGDPTLFGFYIMTDKEEDQMVAPMETILSNYEAIFGLDRLSSLMTSESETARA